MTELSTLALVTPENIAKIGSCGVLLPNTEGKIVDFETGGAKSNRCVLCQGSSGKINIYLSRYVFIFFDFLWLSNVLTKWLFKC